MNRIVFYFQYAARNLWRSRRWSTFAVFSVAAGVATVVALRSLGLAIGDALTSNVRSSNYGDITLEAGGSGGFMSFRSPEEEDTFTDYQLQQVDGWAKEQNAHLTAYTVTSNLQITALDYTAAGRPQFITSLFIDPATFPPTQDILASSPAGTPLGQLFQGGNEVVVSQNLADSQGIQVGETVRVSGTEEEFSVRGIVPATAYLAAGFRDPFAAFFGFAFFSNEVKPKLPVAERPNRISLILPDGTSTEEIRQKADDLRNAAKSSSRNNLRVTSVPLLLDQNQRAAEILGSFIVAMGLGALLIGGVGIVNTMLVMVQRRTEEIAALKTFGLKGRQIAALFMAEALLLGFFGSLFGGLFGVLLSTVANAYGQVMIQMPLTWRIYPEAILYGAALGLIITGVFGVAPVLTAVKVRPATILRPNETVIPRLGCLQSLLMMVLVVVAIGLIAGQILSAAIRGPSAPNPYIVGIITIAITLLILAILVGLLWIVVWIISKLPSFGNVDLRLALRNLTTRRLRTATTLLALTAGMFALSSISFIGAGTRELLQFTLSEAFGGNVLIFPVLPPAIANPLIDNKLNQIEGVSYRTRLLNYSGEIRAVDDQPIDDQGVDPKEIGRQIGAAARTGDLAKVGELSQQLSRYDYSVDLSVTDTNNPNYTSNLEPSSGRNLTLADKGKPVAVVRMNPTLERLGVRVGSTIHLMVSGKPVALEVVGLLSSFDEGDMNFQASMTFGDVMLPPDVLEGVAPQFQLNIAQIEPEHLNQALLDLSSLPLVYSLDISFIDSIMSRFINQFSSLPILVGLLSLGAAGVIMANTVALSTLERRRQIGILKAVGLKNRRVLSVMLLENTIVSLLGGLLGIGLSSLGVVFMSRFGMDITVLIPKDSLPVAIGLVIAAIVIAWVATFLSAKPVVAERVTRVLRYE